MIFILYLLKIEAVAYFWNTEIFDNDDIILIIMDIKKLSHEQNT